MDFRSLGDQYVICQRSGGTDPNVEYPDTRIAVQIMPGRGSWLKGMGFTAFVFFSRPKPANYPIISATISGPSSAAGE